VLGGGGPRPSRAGGQGGYCDQGKPLAAELSEAFEKVRAGAPYCPPNLPLEVALVEKKPVAPPAIPLSDLTPAAKLQMLRCSAEGKSYGDLGGSLGRQLQDRGQCLLAAQAQAGREKSPDLIRLA